MSTNLVVPGPGIGASATASGVSTALVHLVDVKTGFHARGVVDQPWIGLVLGPAASQYMLRLLSPTMEGRLTGTPQGSKHSASLEHVPPAGLATSTAQGHNLNAKYPASQQGRTGM